MAAAAAVVLRRVVCLVGVRSRRWCRRRAAAGVVAAAAAAAAAALMRPGRECRWPAWHGARGGGGSISHVLLFCRRKRTPNTNPRGTSDTATIAGGGGVAGARTTGDADGRDGGASANTATPAANVKKPRSATKPRGTASTATIAGGGAAATPTAAGNKPPTGGSATAATVAHLLALGAAAECEFRNADRCT